VCTKPAELHSSAWWYLGADTVIGPATAVELGRVRASSGMFSGTGSVSSLRMLPARTSSVSTTKRSPRVDGQDRLHVVSDDR
jgi:hypothetical protein